MPARNHTLLSQRLFLYILSVLVVVLLGVILFLLWQKRGSQAASATAVSPTATLTFPASPTSIPSPTTPASTPTETPTATPHPICEWLPFSDTGEIPQAYPPECFSNLLDWGIGADGGQLLFYKTLQRQRGLYGVIKPIGSEADIQVKVDIKKLVAGRFVVILAPSYIPTDASLGFRIQTEDGKAFNVKVISFLPGGYEKEISSSPSDPNWGHTYNVNFKIIGSKVKVIVNKATLVQWEINYDKRFLFVGYQALPMEKASTALDVSVEFP
jgi:hypothetical protein